MKRGIVTAVLAVLVVAVVLVVVVVVRIGTCWGFSTGDESGESTAQTAPPSEEAAEYWTEERMASATNSPMPTC